MVYCINTMRMMQMDVNKHVVLYQIVLTNMYTHNNMRERVGSENRLCSNYLWHTTTTMCWDSAPIECSLLIFVQ